MWTLYPQSAHVLAIALTRRRHLDTDVIVVAISANIGAETPLPATTDSCSALHPRDTPLWCHDTNRQIRTNAPAPWSL